MSIFPNLAIINDEITKTIKSRANNVYASTLMPWIRLSTAVGYSKKNGGGLIIESLPFNKKDKDGKEITYSTDSLTARYGNESSGRIGTDFQNNSIYTSGETVKNRPSPIIEAISVKNGQEGLSKNCEFIIKCHTLKQSELISQYFLEPGFMVLVEFGWNTSLAINQKINLKKDPICEMARYNSYAYVEKKKQASKGTYDAFLGYITGGDIKSGDGDVYNVSVKLTTIGELPSYYQRHIGSSASNETQVKTGLYFNEADIEKNLDKGEDVGKYLFQTMFNELPKTKQFSEVKDILPNETDVLGTPFTSAHNFLNFDKEIQEIISKAYSDGAVVKDSEGKSGELPEGATILDTERFIRLELAFAILNKTERVLKQASVEGCTGVKTYNFEINTNDCVCRAFQNIFSTDKSVLYIPNTYLPQFNLTEVLNATEPVTNIVNINNGKVTKTFNGNLASKPEFNQNISGSMSWKYAFPTNREYNSLTVKEMGSGLGEDKEDKDLIKKKYPSGQYGWLRNLYINFDFFKQVLTRDSFTTLDIYYEILNAISAAANNQWYFEIVEQDNPNTQAKELAVKELTFSGIEGNPINLAPKFYTRGKNTPFIDSSLEIDIPAAMKNSIVGERLSNVVGDSNDTLTNEGVYIGNRGIFSSKGDPLLQKLASFNKSDKETDTSAANSNGYEPTEDEIKAEYRRKFGAPYKGNPRQEASKEQARLSLINKKKKEDEEEIALKNFDVFTSSAGIYPLYTNRKTVKEQFAGFWKSFLATKTTENVNLEDWMIIGTYDDTSAFRMVYMNSGESSLGILLPINFTFSVHGVSGLRVGDIFALNDLPEKFTSSIFQILEVSHEISNGQWITTARAGFRNT